MKFRSPTEHFHHDPPLEDIVLLITKSWNQLLDFIHNNSVWYKWEIIMQIMKFFRILQINLKNATFPFLI